MLMIRAREYFQLGFRKIKLDITKQKIFQADGKNKGIRISTPSCRGGKSNHVVANAS